jgi:large subunit ribosomal protein L5
MFTSVLQHKYNDEIKSKLFESGGYANIMEVPRLEKIVINTGVGTDKDREVLQDALKTLSIISGQAPVTTHSRKNISNFKLRTGMPIGARVTLRRTLMYNFLYRMVSIVFPRVRDFRGLSPKSFDGNGNYSFGITDQSVFPEVDMDVIKNTIGMDVTIVTSAKTDEEARKLLLMFGMPFRQ